MKELDNIKNITGSKQHPFKVPDNYFENFESRLKEKIASAEKGVPSRRISLRPYLALAASIAGFAIISFSLLQFITENRVSEDYYYDLAVLEDSGVIIDEGSISEAYNYLDIDDESAWALEVQDYLASNEVNLEFLLANY